MRRTVSLPVSEGQDDTRPASRRGGGEVVVSRGALPTPIGTLWLYGGPRGLLAIALPGEPPGDTEDQLRHRLARSGARVVTFVDDPSPLREAMAQLGEYFAGRRREFALALDQVGTPFQLQVWRAVATIPFGETRTYAEIARVIGRPAATRAVGAANGANPLPLVIPCHRVIGSDGSLTGYGGGITLKARLLAWERGELGAW